MNGDKVLEVKTSREKKKLKGLVTPAGEIEHM